MDEITKLKLKDFLDFGQDGSGLTIDGDSFQASSETVILSAPAQPGAETDLEIMELEAIGLVQSLNIGTGKGVAEIAEIGTEGTAVVPTATGGRQGRLTKIITKEKSLLKALYGHYLKQNPGASHPKGTQWENLDHPLFKKPIGIVLAYLKLDEDTNPVFMSAEWLQGVMVTSLGGSTSYGDTSITEDVGITWEKTVPYVL